VASNPYRRTPAPGDEVIFGKEPNVTQGKLIGSPISWTFYGEPYSQVAVEGVKTPVLVATAELRRPPCPTCGGPWVVGISPGGYLP